MGAKENAYKTINRLEKSQNKVNFDANLKNTLAGTVQFSFMNSLENLPKSTKQNTIIQWMPSSSDEHRIEHALNYGKTMTLQQALDRGLGLDYGCKCGMRIKTNEKEMSKQLKNMME